ncbi:unnamed protein product [Ilex paraguariensis]|uniref:Uncharacterized protein n=1 Tax=Ilex paraguariensis TaxID=185542 RepID=A0ABC8RKP3_9AQUA
MDTDEQKPGLETPFVSKSEENGAESKEGLNKDEIFMEAKKQLLLGGPLVISVMFVGHVGELALSGASMATSFASVTGFSFLIGLACALDTFCGQSYGAKQYHMLGIHTHRAMFVLLLISIPPACVWAITGHILEFLGQNPQISGETGGYPRFMIPTIFDMALLQCCWRYSSSLVY